MPQWDLLMKLGYGRCQRRVIRLTCIDSRLVMILRAVQLEDVFRSVMTI